MIGFQATFGCICSLPTEQDSNNNKGLIPTTDSQEPKYHLLCHLTIFKELKADLILKLFGTALNCRPVTEISEIFQKREKTTLHKPEMCSVLG